MQPMRCSRGETRVWADDLIAFFNERHCGKKQARFASRPDDHHALRHVDPTSVADMLSNGCLKDDAQGGFVRCYEPRSLVVCGMRQKRCAAP